MNNLLTTGLILSASAGAMYYLKSVPMYFYNKLRKMLIFSVKIYQYDELFDILEKYMCKHYTSEYKDVEACFVQESETNKVVSQGNGWTSISSVVTPILQTFRYKQETNTFIIKYKGKRIIINKAKEKLDHVQNTKDLYFSKFSLSGWRAKSIIEDFINEAIAYSRVNPEENVVRVHSNNTWGEWEAPLTVKVKNMDKVVLPKATKERIMLDVENFISSEEWYYDRGIPYKRGYCFYGPPGTGKTTVALALAQALQRTVRCLNMNTLADDARLLATFKNIPDNSILLIEDIDKIFSGRENVRADSTVSFSSFINCLDGAFHKNGLIVIITTNHIEKLDGALLRTGRIDTKVEIPKPTENEISHYLALFYKEDIPVKGKFNLTMSDVQDICLRNKEDMYIAKQEIIKTIKNEGVQIKP